MSRIVTLAVSLCLAAGSAATAQEATKAAAPTAQVFLKGSTAYNAPADVPLKTALLVGTSRWDSIAGKTRGGQVVAVADVNVLLSNLEISCDNAYALPKPADDASFILVAGTVLVFPETGDWTSTALGKTLADAAQADARHAIDRFGITLWNDKKNMSKEEVKANAGELVLTRTSGQWTAKLSMRDSKGAAQADVPLTLCPMPGRTSNALRANLPKGTPEVGPLLGSMTVLNAIFRY